jgi:hypothetical protein
VCSCFLLLLDKAMIAGASAGEVIHWDIVCNGYHLGQQTPSAAPRDP